MNGTDGFLDIHDSHLRVLDGNIHAKSIILDQLDITSSNTTSSTVQFLNGVTAFKTTANVEIGTANLFVDTSTSNVGILTSTPTHTLDVRGTANVEVLRTSSNIEMNGGTFSLGGHMIPSTNEQYDIGSAEYKIRDMYVSDNSLWIGDKAKISFDITEDKLTFRKRKVSDTFIPAKIIDLAIAGGIENDTTAITNDILNKLAPGNLGAMKLHHWLQYAKGFEPNIKLSDIFDSTNSDYDSTSTAEGTFSGTGALTLPSGTTAQQPTGVAGMIRFNSTSNRLEVYNGSAWQSIGGMSATGGTITTSGGYRIHTFTSSDPFTVISGGEIDYLVVAGGGGGTISTENSVVPGGSGAGGMIEATNQTISPGVYNIVIGAGGQGGARGVYTEYTTRRGQNGSVSSAFGIAPLGGGVGAPGGDDVGTSNSAGRFANTSGGSGGGGTGWRSGFSSGANGESGQGNQGGNGFETSNANRSGGGGGGAGQQGTNGAASSGGTGGNGIESGISGTQVYYAGGGGGIGRSQANGGPVSGGLGGGGKGTYNITPDANGVNGLGGGAGAITSVGTSVVGGTGGDGIVIIRYLL